MITKRLTEALENYICGEFGNHLSDDDLKDLSAIGIAYTEVYDENDPAFEMHEMQINLNLKKLQFEYYLDDELIYVDKCKSQGQIAECIEDTDFQDWYSDFLEHCPEGYC